MRTFTSANAEELIQRQFGNDTHSRERALAGAQQYWTLGPEALQDLAAAWRESKASQLSKIDQLLARAEVAGALIAATEDNMSSNRVAVISGLPRLTVKRLIGTAPLAGQKERSQHK